MRAGNRIIMYFDCIGVTSEEEVVVKSVTKEYITIEDYFDTENGEEYYKFSTDTGKCLNEPKFGFGGKRRLKVNRI